jgi:hypothetical protein
MSLLKRDYGSGTIGLVWIDLWRYRTYRSLQWPLIYSQGESASWREQEDEAVILVLLAKIGSFIDYYVMNAYSKPYTDVCFLQYQ